MKKFIVVALLIILVMVMVAPVGATPSDEVSFTVTAEYTYRPSYSVSGTWGSDGILLDVPKHFGAGGSPGKAFQTAHVIEVVGDDGGTIALRSQMHGFEFFDWYPCGDNFCQDYTGAGNWVILSGSGEYANLHGQGKVTTRGTAEFIIDGDSFKIKGQTTESTYEGSMHSDPT